MQNRDRGNPLTRFALLGVVALAVAACDEASTPFVPEAPTGTEEVTDRPDLAVLTQAMSKGNRDWRFIRGNESAYACLISRKDRRQEGTYDYRIKDLKFSKKAVAQSDGQLAVIRLATVGHDGSVLVRRNCRIPLSRRAVREFSNWAGLKGYSPSLPTLSMDETNDPLLVLAALTNTSCVSAFQPCELEGVTNFCGVEPDHPDCAHGGGTLPPPPPGDFPPPEGDDSPSSSGGGTSAGSGGDDCGDCLPDQPPSAFDEFCQSWAGCTQRYKNAKNPGDPIMTDQERQRILAAIKEVEQLCSEEGAALRKWWQFNRIALWTEKVVGLEYPREATFGYVERDKTRVDYGDVTLWTGAGFNPLTDEKSVDWARTLAHEVQHAMILYKMIPYRSHTEIDAKAQTCT